MKRLLALLLLPLFMLFPGHSAQSETAHDFDFNATILRMIDRMPQGGGYSTNSAAKQGLASAVRAENERVSIHPDVAQPSFCSSATYLVFASVLSNLAEKGQIHLSAEDVEALRVTDQRDGEGVWGRWNANGPGTARLFAETGMGQNFTDWNRARPGDFMKIFWTSEIGSRERGHSVVYLGTENIKGFEHVRFWSSNNPGGYGEKSVPRTKVAWAIFSRLERPARVTRLAGLPKIDTFLASLLKRPSTREEVTSQCGL
jgi:hypothetical protein